MNGAAAAARTPATGHNGEVSAEPPRRGRPRSADADEAILAATLAIAGEVGFRGLAMDVVAERAGVSKATIYRRWSSKEALVLEALQRAINPLDDVDLGSVRDDLVTYLANLGERMASGQTLTARLADEGVPAEGLEISINGSPVKNEAEAGSGMLTISPELDEGANNVRINYYGDPRREVSWVIVTESGS